MCTMCKHRGKTWEGSDPICAFDDKGFLTGKHNWNCVTLCDLRVAILDISNGDSNYHFHENFNGYDIDIDYHWCEDQHYVMIIVDGTALYISWYKSRGSTEYVHIHNLDDGTEEDFITNILLENLDKIWQERQDVKCQNI